MNRNNEKYRPALPRQGMPNPNFVKPAENNGTPKGLPPVILNPGYLQGYLRTQIGKYMRVNFLLGTGTFIDKDGILQEVGVDHIILKDTKTDDNIVADLYSIKFVEIPEDTLSYGNNNFMR
jgi:hypothetical protein